jgi:hypothetical protein
MEDLNTNGCGASKSWFRPPYGIFFKASCNNHDIGYEKGGTEEDRLRCDIDFLRDMIIDTWEIKNRIKRCYYQVWAGLYFLGVRYRGHKHFNYKIN